MTDRLEIETLLKSVQPWSSDNDETLVCRAVRQETSDVKSFLFAASSPRRFQFKPGQFLTFSFEINGTTVNRCYTIASPPTRPYGVAITVKRVPGGVTSNWLHETMQPGLTVLASGPLGAFSALSYPSSKYLLLSGGSGITPLMSMLRTFHDLGIEEDIIFVHAARTPDDIIFRTECAAIARYSPSVKLAHICENDGPMSPATGYRGRISKNLLSLIAPDFLEREVFVCGPPGFMATARTILRERHFDMARYHEESFDFSTPSPATPEIAEADLTPTTRGPKGKVYRIEFSKSRRVVDCPETMTVLDAARQAGLRLPSSCTKGVCGTCKSRLTSGSVTLEHGGGIRQKEIDAGMRLLCCSRPTSDIVVER